jgi:O-6-methylguanine DNA methyltransferase
MALKPSTFERKVLTVVSRIPAGRVATYGDVARLAGRPGAARAVGNILSKANRAGLPYHRVIAAGGRLGGYSSLALKRAMLAAEGLAVTPGRVVGFARVRWTGSSRQGADGKVPRARRRKERRAHAPRK